MLSHPSILSTCTFSDLFIQFMLQFTYGASPCLQSLLPILTHVNDSFYTLHRHIMCDEIHTHVQIFFDFNKTKNIKDCFIYEINDDNKNYTFSNYLFVECFTDSENCDQKTQRKIEPDDIWKRYLCMKAEIQQIDSTTQLKMQRLIDFIIKNYEFYVGIQVIY